MGIGAVADMLGGAAGGGIPGIPLFAPHEIKVDGNALEDDLDELVETVTIVDRLRMPDSCVIVFRDFRHQVVADAEIEVGSSLEVSVATPGSDELVPIFKGEVTSIEAEYDALGMRAVVRGYDRLHRLAAGRKTKTFLNATYADVATKIADEAGLDAEVDDTGAAIDHVIQGNVSDLDFLYQLAARVGFDVGIDDTTLLFKQPGEASSAPGAGEPEDAKPTQLVWGTNLEEFRGRMSAVAQVPEVKVHGWSTKDKKAVIGQAASATTSAILKQKPADLAKAVGGEALVVVDRPVDDQASADDLAKAIAEHVASAAYEATAVAHGSPELRAGVAVSVSEVDANLAGDWVITTARHEFGAVPYRTHLEFSGRQDRSIHGLMAGGTAAPTTRTTMPGVVVGIVTEIDDPDNLGRVKVQYPWLDEQAESYWARLATIGAGPEYGIVWVPQKDDEVLVAFEHGDLSHPYVIGSLWNSQDKPPADMMSDLTKDGEVKRVALVSRRGHALIFQDNDDSDGIILTTEDTKVMIYLDESKTELDLQCDGDVSIKAQGNLTIKADGSISIEAGAKMTLKGATVAIN